MAGPNSTTPPPAGGSGGPNGSGYTATDDPIFTQNLNDLKNMSNQIQNEQMLMRKVSMQLGAEQSIAKEKPAQ